MSCNDRSVFRARLHSHGRIGRSKRKLTNGSATIEVALMMPWLAFLFVGVFDFGFYVSEAIAVQNAARAAAVYNAVSDVVDQPGACTYVLQELKILPNIAPIASTSSCSDSPLQVSANADTIVVNGTVTRATRIDVTYEGIALIPMPTLTGKFSVTRSVWVEQSIP
jgi:Flp pilus assembly protein TadG